KARRVVSDALITCRSPFDSEASHATVEVGAICLKPARGVRYAAAARVEGALDELALDRINALVQRQILVRRRRTGRRIRGDHARALPLPALATRIEDCEPLTDVRELAHVTRPLVTTQRFQRDRCHDGRCEAVPLPQP